MKQGKGETPGVVLPQNSKGKMKNKMMQVKNECKIDLNVQCNCLTICNLPQISFPSPNCAVSIYITTKLFVRRPDLAIVLH